MELTFDNLLAHINTVYILVTASSPTKATPAWMPSDADVEPEGPGMSEPNLRLKVRQLDSSLVIYQPAI